MKSNLRFDPHTIKKCISLLQKKRQQADVRAAKSSSQCNLEGEIIHARDVAVADAWSEAVDLINGLLLKLDH